MFSYLNRSRSLSVPRGTFYCSQFRRLHGGLCFVSDEKKKDLVLHFISVLSRRIIRDRRSHSWCFFSMDNGVHCYDTLKPDHQLPTETKQHSKNQVDKQLDHKTWWLCGCHITTQKQIKEIYCFALRKSSQFIGPLRCFSSFSWSFFITVLCPDV